MDLDLAGRQAAVTGASKGIGLGIARALAREGAHLVIAARSQEPLAAAARSIEADFGVTCTPLSCDLSVSSEQVRLAERLIESGIDIVVNNAGAIPAGSLVDVDEAQWREAWDLKVFGYINLTRLVLPTLEAQGSGVVVNVIGAAADRPSPGYIAGAAGNAALVAFTRAMGSRSLRQGVRILAVNPGLIVTDRLTDLLRRQAIDRLGDPERWEELVPEDPAPGTVDQVADVVVFLASPRSSHVSGTVLTVDGGASAR